MNQMNPPRKNSHVELKNPGLIQMSSVKNPALTFHYTGWLIGILIRVYYNPNITGEDLGFFHCSNDFPLGKGAIFRLSFRASVSPRVPGFHSCPPRRGATKCSVKTRKIRKMSSGCTLVFKDVSHILECETPPNSGKIKLYRNPYTKNDVFKYVPCIFWRIPPKKTRPLQDWSPRIVLLNSLYSTMLNVPVFLGGFKALEKYSRKSNWIISPRFGVRINIWMFPKIGISPNHPL